MAADICARLICELRPRNSILLMSTLRGGLSALASVHPSLGLPSRAQENCGSPLAASWNANWHLIPMRESFSMDTIPEAWRNMRKARMSPRASVCAHTTPRTLMACRRMGGACRPGWAPRQLFSTASSGSSCARTKQLRTVMQSPTRISLSSRPSRSTLTLPEMIMSMPAHSESSSLTKLRMAPVEAFLAKWRVSFPVLMVPLIAADAPDDSVCSSKEKVLWRLTSLSVLLMLLLCTMSLLSAELATTTRSARDVRRALLIVFVASG
mmetsp:Transcript_24777/g.46951  ORF Transcript_24777/g.46951 Transcript_24777/m.46951 type:complete len:267 (+) Transcript_24777:1220-2020(+)